MSYEYKFESSAKPIIIVIELVTPNITLNIAEFKFCLQNTKLGILSDGKKPFSNDYTACAIKIDNNLCVDCHLPDNTYCPGNKWFKNPAKTVQSRIFNGEAAVRSSWPWIVSLSEPGSSSAKFCGGQIVTDEWILTAGMGYHRNKQ